MLVINFKIEKKISGTENGKYYSQLKCSNSCVDSTYKNGTIKCCETDNCNLDTTLSTNGKKVSSCFAGDSSNNTYTAQACVSPANFYCMVSLLLKNNKFLFLSLIIQVTLFAIFNKIFSLGKFKHFNY